MTIRGAGGVTFANQRRSQRILLSVPLCVSGRRADGTAFVEHASTLIVNASGGLVALKEAVRTRAGRDYSVDRASGPGGARP